MLPLAALSPAERRLLPGGRLEGPTPYVIAIMMFVMVVIAAAGLALADSAGRVAAGIESRYTLQIDGGLKRSAEAEALLQRLPGVSQVRPVAEGDMRRMVERWMGPEGASADLPLPAMIDFDLAPGSDAAAVAGRAEAAFPGVRLVAHRVTLGPVMGALRALAWLALALVLLVGAAAAAAVVLATRGALDTHRSTIEVMHGIGATDEQVARLFQRKIALDALVGGTVGAAAAGVVLLAVAGGGATWLADLTGGSLLGTSDILLLAALPLVGTLLATVVARRAVIARLGASL